MLHDLNVIGLRVHSADYESALERVVELSQLDHSTAVSASNTHIAAASRLKPEFGHVMGQFDLVVPDGTPLIWVMNKQLSRQGKPLLNGRVYGPYLMKYVIENAPQHATHFLFGGSLQCLDDLQAAMNVLRPGISIAGAFSPPYRDWTEEDQQDFANVINDAGADFVWVALGGEKQESWIINNQHRFKRGVFFAIGDAFELLAGHRPFAPDWYQRKGLTWVYRLMQDPKRMWKRYCKFNSLFLYYLLVDALKGIGCRSNKEQR